MNSPLRIFVFFLPKIKSRSDQTLVHIGHRMSYCADDQFIIIFARSDMDVAAVLSVARCYTILMLVFFLSANIHRLLAHQHFMMHDYEVLQHQCHDFTLQRKRIFCIDEIR